MRIGFEKFLNDQKRTARQLAHPEHPAVVAVLDAAS
jgi:hypothetical protein